MKKKKLKEKLNQLKFNNEVVYTENVRLRSLLKNRDHNRQWCDDATNYLGPMAQELSIALEVALEEMIKIRDGYYTHNPYPWEDGNERDKATSKATDTEAVSVDQGK